MSQDVQHHADDIHLDPVMLCWVDLLRSHSYLSLVIYQEKFSDLYDVKNPLLVQGILLNLWIDQIYNQTNFICGAGNIALMFLRRHSLMPCGALEEEVYGVLS
jgi:hypothetical protein